MTPSEKQQPQTPLISAIELWRVKPKSSSLVLEKAFYGKKTSFLQASLGTCFALGEGLPGVVAQTKTVQLWPELSQKAGFKRTSSANKVDLHAAIGLPIMKKGQVETVILLFLTLHSAQTQTKAAIELWQPNELGILSLSSSLYKNLDLFAKCSETQYFSVLEGLPGRVFDTKDAHLFPSLSTECDFVRSEAATQADLNAALGFPILDTDNAKAALLLFTSLASPLVQVMEHWHVTKQNKLELAAGYYGVHEAFKELSAALVFKADEGVPGKVFAQKQAMLFNSLAPGGEFVRAQAAVRSGFEVALGIPIFSRGKVVSVVVLIN